VPPAVVNADRHTGEATVPSESNGSKDVTVSISIYGMVTKSHGWFSRYVKLCMLCAVV